MYLDCAGDEMIAKFGSGLSTRDSRRVRCYTTVVAFITANCTFVLIYFSMTIFD